jgi:hypothetical protein
MRVLLTTRGSAGHVLPLAPLAHACIAARHEVLVAAQSQHRANVERARLPFAPVSDPPSEDWMPLMGSCAELDLDGAYALMIGEFFGGIDTRAALPDLLRIVETWQPDVVVRESWEFASVDRCVDRRQRACWRRSAAATPRLPGGQSASAA